MDPVRAPTQYANANYGERVTDAVQRALSRTGATHRDLAEILGIGEKQVKRKLSGTTPYSTQDLMALAIRFGIDILPTVATRDDLFPAELRSSLRWFDRPTGASVVIRDARAGAHEIDWRKVLAIADHRLADDEEVSRRLATRGDLRRHVLVALSASGLAAERVFNGGSPRIDFAVDAGPQLVVTCFVGSSSVETAQGVLEELEALIDAARGIAGEAPSTMVVAALSVELANAVAQLCDSSELNVDIGFDLGAAQTPVRVDVRALSRDRTGVCVAFEVRQQSETFETNQA